MKRYCPSLDAGSARYAALTLQGAMRTAIRRTLLPASACACVARRRASIHLPERLPIYLRPMPRQRFRSNALVTITLPPEPAQVTNQRICVAPLARATASANQIPRKF
ncbi:hypothetical protein KCP69_03730 [Salmonella enterica subsp. enterica]|nr:hypothetical protein KCP69_03730 [Salmonella enterica subsp. enterica]